MHVRPLRLPSSLVLKVLSLRSVEDASGWILSPLATALVVFGVTRRAGLASHIAST